MPGRGCTGVSWGDMGRRAAAHVTPRNPFNPSPESRGRAGQGESVGRVTSLNTLRTRVLGNARRPVQAQGVDKSMPQRRVPLRRGANGVARPEAAGAALEAARSRVHPGALCQPPMRHGHAALARRRTAHPSAIPARRAADRRAATRPPPGAWYRPRCVHRWWRRAAHSNRRLRRRPQ